MQDHSQDSLADVKTIDFGAIPVDETVERSVFITNYGNQPVAYRVSLLYILNNIDRVFNVNVSSELVKPGDNVDIKVQFRPNIVGQSFADYYIIEDTAGNALKITVTGKCFGPEVTLSRRKVKFEITKNVKEVRNYVVNIINTSSVETTYQWLIPEGGQGYFQISTGNCGLIRAYESISVTIIFTGLALGVYTAELVCLVLYQEPLFLHVLALIEHPGAPFFDTKEHYFERSWRKKSRSAHLMENSLNCLDYIPSASVFQRHLDFESGSVRDMTRNISQTLCVTNHEDSDGYVQWISDPDNVFIIDPVATLIPPHESKLFTVRFRPKTENQVYGYLMCGDYQYKLVTEDSIKVKHTNFRIPCIGNTWSPCTEWTTEWDCPTEIVLPPTVPARTTFYNFMLSNKLDIPMYFKFEAPHATNFVVVPMCGIVQSRGWQIITVALEPKELGDYYETWDLTINKVQKARICFCGNAELSQVEIMSPGYNPAAHAMYEFPSTITGATNYCIAYFHNVTRMEIHMRMITGVPWLGADNSGTLILRPKEIYRYHWWFFPNVPDLVYDTTVTCTCVCLIDGRPVGEPKELFIHIFGFSEYPDLKFLLSWMDLEEITFSEKTALCSFFCYKLIL